MKIVYLITGSGGSFYCANCYRDMLYFRAIKKVPGTTAKAIPLYLPPDSDVNREDAFDKNVFFGAISLYMREKIRIFRNMPLFLEKFFNSKPFLRIAAKLAGTTRSEGLEDMTLNMIEGDSAFRPDEMRRLVNYLKSEGMPDVIHLSNALILGLARQIKKMMDVKIVCSLLNEDDWIDDMAEPYKSKSWKMIAAESVYVDGFITPSRYYKEHFMSKTGVIGDNIHVVPLGFDPPEHGKVKDPLKPPAIGFFNRISYHNGFDKLVDAFIMLKSSDDVPGLTLNVCGGYTGVDKPFISEQIRKIREKGLQKSIRIYPEFIGDKKDEFFRDVDIISVPVRKYDGYGLYIIEANSAGVPVVQPATGAFPEIVEMTGGGITYLPDTVEDLAENLKKMMTDAELRKKLSSAGIINVRSQLSLGKMSEGLSMVYKDLTKMN
ncbi:MAG: glycosyltransferase family 4 protein [Bacteroidota bacterium]